MHASIHFKKFVLPLTLVALSAVPTLVLKKCCVIDEWQQSSSCGTAFDKATEVRLGPRVTKRILQLPGGKQTFARKCSNGGCVYKAGARI